MAKRDRADKVALLLKSTGVHVKDQPFLASFPSARVPSYRSVRSIARIAIFGSLSQYLPMPVKPPRRQRHRPDMASALGDLPKGSWRTLTEPEIASL
jgi:hypothetical protein